MTTNARSRTIIPARWRQVTASTLLGTTVAFGLALGSATVAHAEWDIEAYDNCMAKPHQEDPLGKWHMYCCINSGGTVTPDGGCTDSPEATQGTNTEGTGVLRAPLPSHVTGPVRAGIAGFGSASGFNIAGVQCGITL